MKLCYCDNTPLAILEGCIILPSLLPPKVVSLLSPSSFVEVVSQLARGMGENVQRKALEILNSKLEGPRLHLTEEHVSKGVHTIQLGFEPWHVDRKCLLLVIAYPNLVCILLALDPRTLPCLLWWVCWKVWLREIPSLPSTDRRLSLASNC